MKLELINQGRQVDLESALLTAAHLPSWAQTIMSQRPFQSKQDLLKCAEQTFDKVLWDEILTALNKHPKLGEKPSNTQLNSSEQQFSKNEQSSLTLSEQRDVILKKLNGEYDTKFGFIFLMKAQGKSGDEIIAELERRLKNDLETEKLEVKRELKQIALSRLEQMLN